MAKKIRKGKSKEKGRETVRNHNILFRRDPATLLIHRHPLSTPLLFYINIVKTQRMRHFIGTKGREMKRYQQNSSK
jgi:hypothetical protein